jgi:hypothetical protein
MALWALGKLGFKRYASSDEILRITSGKIMALMPNEKIEKKVDHPLFVETKRIKAKRIPIALLPNGVILGILMSNIQVNHVILTHCINDRSNTRPIPIVELS